MKVIGLKTKWKDMANTPGKMGQITKVIGEMDKGMDVVL